MKSITLSNGMEALVDDADWALVARYRWSVLRRGRVLYARTRMRKGDALAPEGERFVYMHRLILGPPPGVRIDHANRNGLDNRRCNLRLASQSQNCANRVKPRSGGTSRFKGVHRESQGSVKIWHAVLKKNGRFVLSKRYETEEQAAEAYNSAARQAFGRFALLNSL